MVGGLGWTPATFWSASLTEFECAWSARSAAPGPGSDTPPITMADARRAARAAGMTLFGE